jgi:hypothetical protein
MLNACSFLEPIYPWVTGKIHNEICVPVKSTKPNKYHWTLSPLLWIPSLDSGDSLVLSQVGRLA